MTSRQPHTVMWSMIWPASTHLRSSSVFLSRIWSLSLNEGWLWLRGREVIRAPAVQGDGKTPRWDFSPRWRPCCRPGSTMEGASGSLPCSSVRRNVASAVPWWSCFHVAAEFRAEDAECIFVFFYELCDETLHPTLPALSFILVTGLN